MQFFRKTVENIKNNRDINLVSTKTKVVICSQNQTIMQLIFFGKIVSNENKKHVINRE